MTTLQEYLNWKYPTKEDKERVREIDAKKIQKEREEQSITEKLEGGEVDLSEYVGLEKARFERFSVETIITKLTLGNKPNLTELVCYNNQLTTIDLSKCPNLIGLNFSVNQLTSIDFLKQLPYPEKLTVLKLANNNIEPTNLKFLRPFINLTGHLTLGNDEPERYNNNIYNRFYGNLEPLRGMTKLPGLCIDGTDVEEGLEYLPTTVKESSFNCSPQLPNQKVAKIQDQLRQFNYDVAAWQLAHPELMLKARPEYFTNPDSREQWINALADKITQTQQELIATKTNTPDKLKRIQRLESKINHLEIIKDLLKQRNQIIEQVQEEREIHQDSLKAMDNFYQQNPPQEEQRLNNILKVFEKDYLKINWENQQKDQKVKELEKTVELIEKLAQQTIRELESKITKLESKKNQTTETRTEIAPKTNFNN